MPQGKLSEKQEQFIDWLLTPRVDRPLDQRSQNQWCISHGVSNSLPAQWKRDNFTFKQALRARFKDLNHEPSRVQEVVDSLQAAAANGDVKAGIFYLQFVGEFQPSEKRIIEKHGGTDKLSNEQLLAEIEAEADRLRAELSMEVTP